MEHTIRMPHVYESMGLKEFEIRAIYDGWLSSLCDALSLMGRYSDFAARYRTLEDWYIECMEMEQVREAREKARGPESFNMVKYANQLLGGKP